MDRVSTLAQGVATLGDSLQTTLGSNQVLLAAVLALARTHPDPQAFAEEFRRVWMLLGSQHSNSEAGEQYLTGIVELLDMLDQVLPVPPRIRP